MFASGRKFSWKAGSRFFTYRIPTNYETELPHFVVKKSAFKKGTAVRQIESCVNLLASRKVTSRSSSRSFLLPTRRMTMAGLARVRASVSQLARLLKDSRELTSYTRRAPEQTNYMVFGTDSDPEGNRIRIQYGSGTLCQAGKGGIWKNFSRTTQNSDIKNTVAIMK